MANEETKMLYCERCHRTKQSKDFYKTYRLDKYPDGYINECKDCITLHIDNWDPSTFLWVLEECDVPYIPDVWNELLNRYSKGDKKITGKTVIGRYISNMYMHQYSNYRWADTEKIQEEKNRKLENAMRDRGYSDAQIQEVLAKSNELVVDIKSTRPENDTVEDIEDFLNMVKPPPKPAVDPFKEADGLVFEEKTSEIEVDPLGDELTEDDKKYLLIKWGKYKPSEWIKLEQLYLEMEKAYDVQSPAHKDTLKLICKTSLKANQLIDINDIEGFQKISRVYDQLMKSGKFTAAQIKADKGNYIDSISELVAICERDGFIPAYYTSGPQDKVDETLEDFKGYVRDLVTDEMNLGNLIEDAVRQMVELEHKDEDEDKDDDDITLEELDIQDYLDYNEFVEGENDIDDASLLEFLDEGRDS